MQTETLDIKESNLVINSYLTNNEPFMICRLSDNATKLSLYYIYSQTIHQHIKERASKYDGIYFDPSQNENDTKLYATIYYNALKNMSLFVCYPKLCVMEQNAIIKALEIKSKSILHNRVLEPFYLMDDTNMDIMNNIPWTHELRNKRVLIISPFVDTFKSQIEKGFKFFGDDNPCVWLPEQQFVFYKCYNTLYNNRPHKNWFETFAIMCKDISKLNFDIALLSCGGYGLPLCNYIYKNLGKSSIYMGGSLQLLFGVYGERWINHSIISKCISDYPLYWTRPSDDEQPENYKKVEGGCYW